MMHRWEARTVNYTIFKKPIPKAIYTYSNVTTKTPYFSKKLVISIIKLINSLFRMLEINVTNGQ